MATVDGVPPPKVEWFLDDQPVTESEKYSITKEGKIHRLSIKAVDTADEGEYKLVASNKQASTSFAAEVLVSEVKTPKGSVKVEKINAVEGDKICFEVVAEGAEGVSWLQEGKELRNSKKYEISRIDDNNTTLVVKNCENGDSGTYICELVKGPKKTSLECVLIVSEKVKEKEEVEKVDIDTEDGKRKIGLYLLFRAGFFVIF